MTFIFYIQVYYIIIGQVSFEFILTYFPVAWFCIIFTSTSLYYVIIFIQANYQANNITYVDGLNSPLNTWSLEQKAYKSNNCMKHEKRLKLWIAVHETRYEFHNYILK